MSLNLTFIEENPDNLKSGDIGDFDNIVHNAYIWCQDKETVLRLL